MLAALCFFFRGLTNLEGEQDPRNTRTIKIILSLFINFAEL
jgi:hypothetical protein